MIAASCARRSSEFTNHQPPTTNQQSPATITKTETSHMRHIKNSQFRYAWVGAMLFAAIGCHDLLTVQNPQAFTNEAANSTGLLPAVAAGAEGGVQVAVGNLA